MSVEGRVENLRRRHEILDKKISELERRPGADSLEILELKKQKLVLKEKRQALERN